jgi:uncharacterized protein
MAMTALLWALAIALSATGLAGLVLPVLPGAPLLFAGLLTAAWADHFAYVGARTLTVLGIMAVVAMLADFAAGALGAKRFGASRRAAVGAAIGATIGIFFALPGIVLGPLIGAVLGELSARSDLQAASRAGIGTTIGLLLGTAAKLAIGFAMVGLFVVVRFF